MPFPIAMALLLGYSKLPIYIGTYTQHGSKGIYRTLLDTRTGQLSTPTLAGEADNPSYVILRRGRHRLYCVHEGDNASVSAFKVGRHGKLTLLGTQPTKGGADCHLSLDHRGRHLFVASYVGGFVSCFPVLPNGSLGPVASEIHNEGTGPNKSRQDQSHMHSAQQGPRAGVVYSCDLGTDRVQAYHLDSKSGRLTEAVAKGAKVPPGDGPRHVAFSQDGHYMFVNGEMGNTVTAFHIRADGGLKELKTYETIPHFRVTDKDTTAEIQLHPNGRFLYVSTRGDDSISVFHVRPHGNLKRVEVKSLSVRIPRGFQIDPTGRWLVVAGQKSDSLESYRISPRSGRLISRAILKGISSPVCVQFAN